MQVHDHQERFDGIRSVLAVCAHPDDESFGMGAVLSGLVARGVTASLLCCTHGEASTLGADGGDLASRRADELAAAAAELGLRQVTLHHHPDGALAGCPVDDLLPEVDQAIDAAGADCLLVFDEGGITGHPDHQQATAAALAAAARRGLPVLAWTLHEDVAGTLREQFGMPFVGRSDDELHHRITVDRERQWAAIRCHATQSSDNPVLLRRLALQRDTEVLRWLLEGDER